MKWFACEIPADQPLTSVEKALGGCGLLSFLVSLLGIGLLCGCASPDCGSKTIVGNHYSLPKISNDTSNTDIEVYESTEGASVYTRKDSKVVISFKNDTTTDIIGMWKKVGTMALTVEIEPLADCDEEAGDGNK